MMNTVLFVLCSIVFVGTLIAHGIALHREITHFERRSNQRSHIIGNAFAYVFFCIILYILNSAALIDGANISPSTLQMGRITVLALFVLISYCEFRCFIKYDPLAACVQMHE